MASAQNAQSADNLQKQTVALRATFDKLKAKSQKLWKGILSDENMKEVLGKEIQRVGLRLEKIQHRIGLRMRAKKEYGKTIAQTEDAYKKIIESSQSMLDVLAYQAGEGEQVEVSADVAALMDEAGAEEADK
jgi:Sjoegren syndrome nuclear autoantigen 1